jgi:hypothetical protein
VQKFKGEILKVVLAKFLTLSYAVIIISVIIGVGEHKGLQNREPRSCLGRVFNFKLVYFCDKLYVIYQPAHI